VSDSSDAPVSKFGCALPVGPIGTGLDSDPFKGHVAVSEAGIDQSV
jgi:hypothetical protein